MNNKTRNYLIIIIVFTFLTRWLLFLDSGVFYSDDDAGFALASHDFNLYEARPHIPGYILYVHWTGLLNNVFDHAFISMEITILIVSILSSVFVFLFLKEYFNGEKSFILSLLILTNPLIWFYECTPETYAFDLMFSSLIAYLYIKRKSYYLFLPLISILGGIRMSSAFFLAPLYLYITYVYYKENKINIKSLTVANVIGIALTISWVIPLVNSVGGFADYIKLYKTHNPMPDLGTIKNLAAFVSYGISFLFPFYILFIISLFKKDKQWKIPLKESYFLLIWFVPSIIFFLLMHYSKGYIYLIYLPMIIYLGKFYFNNFKSKNILYAIISLQIIFFLFYPYNEPKIDSLVQRSAREGSTVAVALDRLQNGYLHSIDKFHYLEEMQDHITDIVEYMDENFDDYILFDTRSTRLIINSLAYNFPEHTFMTIKDFGDEDLYVKQNWLNYDIYRSENEFSKVFVIARNDMYEKSYKDISKVIYKNDKLTVFKVLDGEEDRMREIYTKFYNR